MTQTPAPCNPQTEAEINAWLKANVVAGTELVIRETQGHFLSYRRIKVDGIGKGKFYTNQGSFYYTGKNCYHPKGQTRVVIPTEATLTACDDTSVRNLESFLFSV